MNDDMMILYSHLEYAVRRLRRSQTMYCAQDEVEQFLLSTSEKQVDDLLLKIEALREKQRRALRACV